MTISHVDRPIIGWREWVSLPELAIQRIKPKIDTGARSSSLHALALESFRRQGKAWVRFRIRPIQRNSSKIVTAECKVLEFRRVRSSTGQSAMRPVIMTDIELMGYRWAIELTLADREEMGFRMLLGREAIRGRFLVDANRSYCAGLPRKTTFASRKKRGSKR